MIHYVDGFLFDLEFERVVLIFKLKGPESIRYKWNGVGGKVEIGEDIYDAMAREFKEEAGVYLQPERWIHYTVLKASESHRIDFFYSSSVLVDKVLSLEEETVQVFPVSDLPDHLHPDLKWLLPLVNQERLNYPITITENI